MTKIKIEKVSDLNKIKEAFKEPLGKAMKTHAEETIRAVVEKHVQEDVYDTYEHPKVYQRRYDNGGLMDRDNMVGVLDLNGKTVAKYKARLFFSNITTKNPVIHIFTKDGGHDVLDTGFEEGENKYLTPIVENGRGYTFDWEDDNGIPNPPRPFMYNSYVELKQHDTILEDDIEDGLKAQGFNTRRL